MALRELLAYFRIDVQTAALRRADKQINTTKANTQGLFNTLGTLRNAFLGLGVVVAANKMRQWAQETLTAADASAKTAERLGFTLSQFEAMEAFVVTSGGTLGGAQNIFKRLGAAAYDAGQGSKEASDAFKALGVEASDAQGNLKPLGQLSEETLLAFSELEDQTLKVALAQKLLGRNGIAILPGLKGGAESVKALLAEAGELGQTFDEDFVGPAQRANDLMFYFGRQMLRLRSILIGQFLPGINEGLLAFTKWIRSAGTMIKAQVDLRSAFQSAGLTTFIGALLSVIKRFGGIRGVIRVLMPWVNRLFFAFLRFALPFLIFEDFFAFLDGRKSLIGDVLEELGLIDDAAEDGKKLKEIIQSWIPAIKKAVKQIVRFFTEVEIGFGAMVGMSQASNEDMRQDNEDVFSRNTSTINDFFDTFFSGTNGIGNIWRLTMGRIAGWTIDAVTWIGTLFPRAAITAGDGIVSGFTWAIETVSGVIQWLVGFIDSVFGTDLAGAVDDATNNIVSAFTGAWDEARAGLSALVADIQSAGETIKSFITDPIRAVAEFATGTDAETFRKDIESFNAQQRAKLSARAQGSTTVIDRSTTTVTVPAQSSPGAMGREIAKAVTKAKTSNRKRTLAAVQ